MYVLYKNSKFNSFEFSLITIYVFHKFQIQYTTHYYVPVCVSQFHFILIFYMYMKSIPNLDYFSILITIIMYQTIICVNFFNFHF